MKNSCSNGFSFNQTTINSALTQDIDGKDVFTIKC